MRMLRDIVCGALIALCVTALVPTLNARQQVTQPGVVPGPTPVQVVGPTPLAVSGSVAAQQVGAWTVTAEQAGTWTVRLAEPAPLATPAFIRRGACYVLLTDIARSPSPSPVYRVNEVQNG